MLRIFSVLTILPILLAACAYGPSPEEIAAREAAERRRVEQAAIAAEAERQRLLALKVKMLDLESQGDKAQQKQKYKKALGFYSQSLQVGYQDAGFEQRIRNSAINLKRKKLRKMKLPEDIRRHRVRASAHIQSGAIKDAAKEFTQALLVAPYWGEGYYNLALVQEKLGEYKSAINNLNHYLESKPPKNERRLVQDKLYALELMLEKANQIRALAGTWRGGTVNVNGDQLQVHGSAGSFTYHINAKIDQNAFNGTISFDANHLGVTNTCVTPATTKPLLSGTIDHERNQITFEYMATEYTFKEHDAEMIAKDFFGDKDRCLSITPSSQTRSSITLSR